jgi:alpha-ribazole phosphatase
MDARLFVKGIFSMKTYKIHLIRHGRESAPGVVRYIGKTNLPLTARGREELIQMVDEEPFPFVEAVYCSPLLRCRQTVEILYPEHEPIIEEGLSECDFGEFEDKTPEELKDNPDYAQWLSGGTPPGGESGEQFFKRSVVAFAKIVEEAMKKGQTDIAVCCHGGSIMAILAQCGLPERTPSDWICAPGHGYTLRVTPGVWMRGYKAEVYAKF